jgi:hypothetical protein
MKCLQVKDFRVGTATESFVCVPDEDVLANQLTCKIHLLLSISTMISPFSQKPHEGLASLTELQLLHQK